MAFDPISAVADLIKVGLEKWVPDANARQEAAMAIAGQIHSQVMAQIEVNRVEAEHQNLFVSGWRPAIGWICGGAYAYNFVLQPFLVFLAAAFDAPIAYTHLPHLDWSEIGMVLMGMLGLGGMRSWEKIKGA